MEVQLACIWMGDDYWLQRRHDGPNGRLLRQSALRFLASSLVSVSEFAVER